MKSTVPGEIVNSRGGFEEHYRRAVNWRRVTSYKFRHARDFEVIQAADKSAFEALGEEFSKHGNRDSLFGTREFG